MNADDALTSKGAIYVIYSKHPRDERMYVGQTAQTIQGRFQKHWSDGQVQRSRQEKWCDIPMDDVIQVIGIKKVSVMCAELVEKKESLTKNGKVDARVERPGG